MLIVKRAATVVFDLNKNEHSRAIHRGLGSVDIAAAARSILLVEADKRDEMIRYVRNIKCNYDGAEHARILLHLDDEIICCSVFTISNDDIQQ